ncbi:MAG: choice-of-anchor D domain-containing protein [Bacteroidota bacterium]
MKKFKLLKNRNRFFRQQFFFFIIAAVISLFFTCTTVFALESHPGHTRANPPASGYWYSDVPGSYDPWVDDIQETILKWLPSNQALSSKNGSNWEHIRMERYGEAIGWDNGYYNRPNGPQTEGDWSFVDLGLPENRPGGTNWVHGHNNYPLDTWVLQFDDVGSFDSWYVPEQELSQYRGIAIEVSNLGDTYLMIDSGMNKWLGKGHGARIGLEPGETDIIYHPFRRSVEEVDAVSPGLSAELGYVHHLTGYPGGQLFESVFSDIKGAEGPWGINAKVPQGVKKGNVKWTINRMWAGGRYEPPTVEEVTAPDYGTNDDTWTDDFGQWRHDDWSGKLWNDQDAIQQYMKLETYLINNPGPSEWDEWGGWEAGPQLEATGWFRVEKFNDKWWFVDPNGRLFLSQGSLHMSANAPKAAKIAGYQSDNPDAPNYFPDEVYFPRLRSAGLNTAGGNSSWKWHEGKLPYTYQIKTGLAPIGEDDILANGGEEGFTQWMINYLRHAISYASDPFCIGFIVDNELNISGGATLGKFEVERIYFGAIRKGLAELAKEVGRPSLLLIDPASNGGKWMANYADVLAMHRMDGYFPATHKGKFKAEKTWGIDRPVGQFTFTMGTLDQGIAHYGLTMFLNQRNRAQGVADYMSRAYSNKNNIANHMYSYMKTKNRPLAEFRMFTNITDTTDYELVKRLGDLGNKMYHIHIGDDPNDGKPMAFDYTYVTKKGINKKIHLHGVDIEDFAKTPRPTLTWQLVDGPAHGSLSDVSGNLNESGFPTYIPNGTSDGVTDTFTFTVTDSDTNISVPATVSVKIEGLAAHWTMDAGAGSVLNDATGHGYNGAFKDGEPTWVGGGPVVGGGALKFSNPYTTKAVWNGIEEKYIDELVEGAVVDFSNPVKLSGDWTVAFWVQRKDSGPRATLFSGDNGVAIELEQEDNSGKVGITNGNLKWVFDYSAPVGEWVHLAVVKKNQSLLLYVNGEPAIPVDAEGKPIDPIGFLRADLELSVNTMGRMLDAIVDDVRFYNYALTPTKLDEFSRDLSFIDYHGTVFSETEANQGQLDTIMTMTLVNGGNFSANITDSISVSNYPNGLTPVLARISDTEVTLSFTGSATEHASDVSSMSISFGDNAFASNVAANVSNSVRNDLKIDFFNARITTSSKTFQESGANNGSLTGTVVFTLSQGEYFSNTADWANAPPVVIPNLPDGLTASFTRISNSEVSMAINGTTTAHESVHKVSDLNVQFLDEAFQSGNAAVVEHTSINDLEINFESSVYFLEVEDARAGNASLVKLDEASGGYYMLGNSAYSIIWDVNVPWTAEADLVLYYSSGNDKYIQSIAVGQETESGPVKQTFYTNVLLPDTNREWENFQPIGPFRVSLKQGMNTIEFHMSGNAPNFDFLKVTLLPTPENITPDINVIGNGHPIVNGDTSPHRDDDTDFGTPGYRGTTHTFSIHNNGSQPLVLDELTPVEINGDEVAFTLTPPLVTTLAPGESTNFSVKFLPIQTGTHSAIISIINNDPGQNPFIFTIGGEGYVEPNAIVKGNNIHIISGDASPSSTDGTDYGTVIEGQHVDHIFSIHNGGIGDFNLDGDVTLSGSPDFTVTSQPPSLLTRAKTGNFTIRFTPGISGVQYATVNINSNDPTHSPYTFVVGGISQLDEAEIDVRGQLISIYDGSITASESDGTDFGKTSGKPVDQVFTVHNIGTQPLNLSGIEVIGSDFVIVSAPASVIAPGESSDFTVRFQPTGKGMLSAVISIANNDSDESPFTFTVQGNNDNVDLTPIIMYLLDDEDIPAE